jgi:DNA-binding NarL/FixJ family response regulator
MLGTVIVSRPGILQQALRASLAACAGLVVEASLGDGLTALNYIAVRRPPLLVVDCNLLDDEVEALLVAVRALAGPTRCLVLIRSPQRESWALACGADAILLRDSSMQELTAVLIQLRAGSNKEEGEAEVHSRRTRRSDQSQ